MAETKMNKLWITVSDDKFVMEVEDLLLTRFPKLYNGLIKMFDIGDFRLHVLEARKQGQNPFAIASMYMQHITAKGIAK